jgi:hypothetical protein
LGVDDASGLLLLLLSDEPPPYPSTLALTLVADEVGEKAGLAAVVEAEDLEVGVVTLLKLLLPLLLRPGEPPVLLPLLPTLLLMIARTRAGPLARDGDGRARAGRVGVSLSLLATTRRLASLIVAWLL